MCYVRTYVWHEPPANEQYQQRARSDKGFFLSNPEVRNPTTRIPCVIGEIIRVLSWQPLKSYVLKISIRQVCYKIGWFIYYVFSDCLWITKISQEGTPSRADIQPFFFTEPTIILWIVSVKFQFSTYSDLGKTWLVGHLRLKGRNKYIRV